MVERHPLSATVIVRLGWAAVNGCVAQIKGGPLDPSGCDAEASGRDGTSNLAGQGLLHQLGIVAWHWYLDVGEVLDIDHAATPE